jgi:hypothetical protein
MASTTIQNPVERVHFHKLNVARLLVTGAVTAATIFVLCWLGTFIPMSSPTHAYITLFTAAEMSSLRSLAEGTAWSLLFGALSGTLFASIYNFFGRFSR